MQVIRGYASTVSVKAIHDAVASGSLSEVERLLSDDPMLVHARGVDGGRPLHFCTNVDIAELLVDSGADVDARDDDHDSTPAQWRIGDAPEVVRFLLGRGATPDIFLAAALDDLALVRSLLEKCPECTTYRIGNNSGPFPGIGFEGRGGTILQWTLGFNRSPHEIASLRGHARVFTALLEQTPPRSALLVACMLPDRELAERIVAEHPAVTAELGSEDHQLLAKACWETNKDIDAVRLMLDLGFPVDVPEHNHGFTALHNAAWCGDAALVELLLEHGHPVDLRDPDHHSTAIGWALHSRFEARRHPHGEFARVVELLIEAGTPLDRDQRSVADPAIDAVLKRSP